MKKIVCIGDSLTEAADLDRKDTWPMLLGVMLKLKIINKGIGRDTRGGLLARFYHDVVPNTIWKMGFIPTTAATI